MAYIDLEHTSEPARLRRQVELHVFYPHNGCVEESHGRHWRRVALRLGIVVVCLVLLLVFGHLIAEWMPRLETWIHDMGIMGPIVFALLVVVLTTILVPDTIMAIGAGVLFGFWGGFVTMVVACMVTCAVNYVIARKLLRQRFRDLTEKHPKLQVVTKVAQQDSVRMQFLVRLLPLSPVAVNYSLSAAGVSFTSYMIAAPGLLLGIAMEVYIGYAASHVTKVAGNLDTDSPTHTVLTVAGLILSLIATALIVHMARKSLARLDATPPTKSADPDKPAGPVEPSVSQ
jgi:uncharacterized membrane protein YdjX (TVP38/TMEM64 family)